MKEAIILAGGLGTRLQSVIKDLPKPLASVNQRPFLYYILDYLNHYKFESVILSVGYLNEKFQDLIGRQYKNIKIKYAVEQVRLGTGGGIKHALKYSSLDNILVLNGDTFFDVNLNNLYSLHENKSSDFTIALRKVNNVSRYGEVITDNHKRIISFKEKYKNPKPGFINAGIYIVNKPKFELYSLQNVFSLETELFPILLKHKNIYGLECNGYFIDIGIPEDYSKANEDFKHFEY